MKNIQIIYSFYILLTISLFTVSISAYETYEAGLQEKLFDAFKNKGSEYKPRTKFIDENGQPEFINRLILEDSPYLLQHAHNPVNWFAWGEEAFTRASEENKPVFLSIGYSTCHWCHVMEKESFENIEIASYLNEHFISIKVDRERRPEVDEIYLMALMLTKGQGGWPMSGFLLHDGLPFYIDSYLPPDKFLALLKEINQAWEQKQNEIVKYASSLGDAVKETIQVQGNMVPIDDGIIQHAVNEILKIYDSVHGGFGGPQKFPNESLLFLLLQAAQRQEHVEALTAIEHTLNMMAQGGIYDQVSGGFHRYATDSEWLVPHFEKMLYNQANLSRVYNQAYQLTGNHYFKRIAIQTIDYVLREMTSADGVFYSAIDADINGQEGLYYLWTLADLNRILAPEDVRFVMQIYNVSETGNFEGANILHLSDSLSVLADRLFMEEKTLLARLDDIHSILLDFRMQKDAPIRDKKIIVAWNGMMITALAEAYSVLAKPEYLASAKRAAEYLWNQQRRPDGSLWRLNLDGQASIPAAQEDYAYFIEAMICLYDVTGDKKWLERSQSLTDVMLKKFWDHNNGGFLMSEQDDILFEVPEQTRDSSFPSGNSVALLGLSRLSNRTYDIRNEKLARQLLEKYSGTLANYPASSGYMIKGLDILLHGEAGPIEYAANGAVRISALFDDNSLLTFKITIGPGWHINAHQPLQDYLIPFNLELINHTDLWWLENINYPEPVYKTLGFDEGKLALYEGKIEIHAELGSLIKQTDMKTRIIDLQLQLQACNDEICLPPETVIMEVATHPL